MTVRSFPHTHTHTHSLTGRAVTLYFRSDHEGNTSRGNEMEDRVVFLPSDAIYDALAVGTHRRSDTLTQAHHGRCADCAPRESSGNGRTGRSRESRSFYFTASLEGARDDRLVSRGRGKARRSPRSICYRSPCLLSCMHSFDRASRARRWKKLFFSRQRRAASTQALRVTVRNVVYSD